jgi:hypothetical protein
MKLVGESFDTAPWTNESDLPLDVAFAYALNLSFSDDVHCLVPADCPQRRVETGKPETGIDSTFDEPVVRLDGKLSAAVHDCSRKSCTAAESLRSFFYTF